jgi:hypothetical protein
MAKLYIVEEYNTFIQTCFVLSYVFLLYVAEEYHTQDDELAQHQVSMLLFLALACGIGMLLCHQAVWYSNID